MEITSRYTARKEGLKRFFTGKPCINEILKRGILRQGNVFVDNVEMILMQIKIGLEQ